MSVCDCNNQPQEETEWKTRVFDSLALPALILKPNRKIISANKAFLRKYNLKEEQVLGKTCHDFFYRSKDYCPLKTCPLPDVFNQRMGQSILRRVQGPDGQEIWEDRVFSPILDEHGEVEFIIEGIRDVTHVKALEKELSGIKVFMEKLIQSSTSGIVAADRKGKILFMNPAAEELIGYSYEYAKENVNVKDLYPPGQAKEIMRKLRDKKLGGKGKLPCTRTFLVNAKGEKIPVELTAAIIYEGDQEVATMGIFNDLRPKLADEERMSKMLARIAQAEKMASLGQLAAGVAHEINNPLTGILLYANILLDTLEEDDPRRQDAQNIVEDAHRCAEIVKNLLAYSRQTSPKEEILHVNNLLEYSLNLIRDQKLFLNVKLVKNLSDKILLVRVDKNQFSQVIINLVINAVDAMSGKGTLTFRTYSNKELQKVYLEISDTGCGIPKENLSRIFDPFFTTKEPGKGTGLGLSTVYGIVKESGGNISVKETGPEGTTFLIELPLVQLQDDSLEPSLTQFQTSSERSPL